MILFKDLKKGQRIYVLNRNTAELLQGIAEESASLPHYDPHHPVMLVDIKLSIGTESRTYSIPENLAVTYANDLCIATDQSDLLPEVEQIERKADDAIADYERQIKVKERCKNLVLELNPQLKAQQETEERFNRLEDSMQTLSSMFQTFMKNHSQS